MYTWERGGEGRGREGMDTSPIPPALHIPIYFLTLAFSGILSSFIQEYVWKKHIENLFHGDVCIFT